VNVAVSKSVAPSVSVAVNVMVSAPFQSGYGVVIVAIRLIIEIDSSTFPEYVHSMSSSGSSTSVT